MQLFERNLSRFIRSSCGSPLNPQISSASSAIEPLAVGRQRCNTFRATGITDYLSNGGTLEIAQRVAGHANAKTTGLYDRRNDDISVSEVERAGFENASHFVESFLTAIALKPLQTR